MAEGPLTGSEASVSPQKGGTSGSPHWLVRKLLCTAVQVVDDSEDSGRLLLQESRGSSYS